MGHNTVVDFRVGGKVRGVSGLGLFLIGGEGVGGGAQISIRVCRPACYWREVGLRARGGECFRLVEVQTRWTRE